MYNLLGAFAYNASNTSFLFFLFRGKFKEGLELYIHKGGRGVGFTEDFY